MPLLTFTSTTYGELAILPLPPMGDAQETLEFFTDVLASYNQETETRSQMRAIPRHTITYNYSLKYIQQQSVFNVGSTWIRKSWAIPFWSEAQKIDVEVGQVSYALDTLVHDLRANGLMLLFNRWAQWQILEISAVTATAVTATASTIAGKVYAVPLRVGWIDGDLTFAPSGFQNAVKLKFNIDDVLTGLGAAVPTQYAGFDLYSDPYLIPAGSSGLTKLAQTNNQNDFALGNVSHQTPWLASQYAKQYQHDGVGAGDIRSIKEFFCRRAGKMNPFMSPSFESNLRKASTGAIGTAFKFYDDGYVAQLSAKRVRLGFFLSDGTLQVRLASNPVDLGDGSSQVTLDSSLGVDASRVLYVSYVVLNRLDTDRLELNHKTGGYFTTSFQVLELTP